MKKKRITNQMFKCDVLFLIGRKQEIIEFFEKQVFGKKKTNYRLRENCKGYTREELMKSINSSNGFANRVLFDITTGNNIILATVLIDSKRNIEVLKETKNIKGYIKSLKFVFSHELRHAVDIIIDNRRLSYDDKELTANLQGWINSEFEETRDGYIVEELPEIINSFLNKN